jgi:hypothetical protein
LVKFARLKFVVIKYVIIAILSGLCSWAFSQKNLTTFGVSFKPMIAGSLLNEGDPSSSENNVDYFTDKAFGYSAGMVVRHNFTKLFAVESGINYTRRNFDMRVEDPSNDYTFHQQFGVIAYEIPIQALVYIQLSKQIFMDASFGLVADLFPSDVAVFDREDKIIMEGRRRSWFQGALTANIGWEWRTQKNGAFYLGGTYHRTFGDMYGFLMQYDADPSSISSIPIRMNNIVNGNYLTIDLRYFFHANIDEQKERRKTRRSNRNKWR